MAAAAVCNYEVKERRQRTLVLTFFGIYIHYIKRICKEKERRSHCGVEREREREREGKTKNIHYYILKSLEA